MQWPPGQCKVVKWRKVRVEKPKRVRVETWKKVKVEKQPEVKVKKPKKVKAEKQQKVKAEKQQMMKVEKAKKVKVEQPTAIERAPLSEPSLEQTPEGIIRTTERARGEDQPLNEASGGESRVVELKATPAPAPTAMDTMQPKTSLFYDTERDSFWEDAQDRWAS